MTKLYFAMCAVLFGLLGYFLSCWFQDSALRVVLSTLAGAAGGLGVACSSVQVLRLLQARRKETL